MSRYSVGFCSGAGSRLKISTITPRSCSVGRYATLMPGPNVPLRTAFCPFSAMSANAWSKFVGATALLGEEACVVALVVERLDQLPLHRADHRCREPPGAVDLPSVLVQSFRLAGVELDDLPRPDPVVVDIPPHRRLEIANDDSDLERLDERGLAHQPAEYYPSAETLACTSVLSPEVVLRSPVALSRGQAGGRQRRRGMLPSDGDFLSSGYPRAHVADRDGVFRGEPIRRACALLFHLSW